MDITIGARDGRTGRFNFVKDPATGDVSFDDTEAHAVMTSALDDLGADWYNPNAGSDLGKMRQLSSQTETRAKSTVTASEQPLVAVGRISDLVVTAKTSKRRNVGALEVDVAWKNAAGDPQSRGGL